MRKTKDYQDILDPQYIIPGHQYQLRQLPLGICFRVAGDPSTYETITYPPVHPNILLCKRDCWNLSMKRMELISYGQAVQAV